MLKVINNCCCGLDVHKKTVKACLLKAKNTQRYDETIKTFNTMTSDLENLKAWLLEEGCTQVVIESTGKLWIPVFNVLEESVEIILANARFVKNVPGRKTDTNDARWLAKLLALGLVQGSFIPPRYIRELRDLTRRRQKLVQMRTSERNRLQDVLKTSNIMLSNVASDVFGVSCMAMINVLISGEEEEYAASTIANLAKGVLRRKASDLIEALNGKLNDHHKNLITHILNHLKLLEDQITALEQMIDQKCEPYSELINILDSHPGIDKIAAQALLAEIGTNMDVFHSADHLASWCGLSPGNHESAGKRKCTKVRSGNNYVKTIVSQCAHVAAYTKNTYIASRYWSIRSHRGPQKATIATARKIMTTLYHMIKNKQYYQEPGEDAYRQARHKNRTRTMKRKLEALGFEVIEKQTVV